MNLLFPTFYTCGQSPEVFLLSPTERMQIKALSRSKKARELWSQLAEAPEQIPHFAQEETKSELKLRCHNVNVLTNSQLRRVTSIPSLLIYAWHNQAYHASDFYSFKKREGHMSSHVNYTMLKICIRCKGGIRCIVDQSSLVFVQLLLTSYNELRRISFRLFIISHNKRCLRPCVPSNPLVIRKLIHVSKIMFQCFTLPASCYNQFLRIITCNKVSRCTSLAMFLYICCVR